MYVREVAEPVYKPPGDATAKLLRAIAQPPATPPGRGCRSSTSQLNLSRSVTETLKQPSASHRRC